MGNGWHGGGGGGGGRDTHYVTFFQTTISFVARLCELIPELFLLRKVLRFQS